MYWGVEVQPHVILTLELEGLVVIIKPWSLHPEDRAPSTHQVRGWGLGGFQSQCGHGDEEDNHCPTQESNPGHLTLVIILQLAIPTPIQTTQMDRNGSYMKKSHCSELLMISRCHSQKLWLVSSIVSIYTNSPQLTLLINVKITKFNVGLPESQQYKCFFTLY
jgi:hypothetical protein